jgi:leucyl aminopeptidase
MGTQIMQAAVYFDHELQNIPVYADLSYFAKPAQIAQAGVKGALSHWPWQLDQYGLTTASFKTSTQKYSRLADGEELVGKAITFDTGGISIKPAGGMEDMKWDMGGAGAVAGAMLTLAARKSKAHVVGICGLVENMPDGNAQRPGDVVTSMSGQTIEVLNTDAEGRLVLADALTYTQRRFKPKFVVDLATLTGAIVQTLGFEHAGVFSNDDQLVQRIQAAGRTTGERVWQLPLDPFYDKMIKSKIADMKNIGGGNSGAITAAQFLLRFIEKTPWAHLDIAGVAWQDGEQKPTIPSWGTGWGVRLLNRMVKDHYES